MASAESVVCAEPDCDESLFGFAAARESTPGKPWRCPEHRKQS